MSSAQAVIRSAPTSIIGAQMLNTSNSIWPPMNPALSKGFIRQELVCIDQSGMVLAPGSTNRFQAPRDVDIATDVALRFVASGLPAVSWGAGATFARWVDFLGLQSWQDMEVRSGTQRLQLVNPLEVMIYILFWVPQEERRKIFNIVGQVCDFFFTVRYPIAVLTGNKTNNLLSVSYS
jgi:hypothetical protein